MKKYTAENPAHKHSAMKKVLSILFVLIVSSQVLKAQQGFGTSNPAPSSVIDMTATNKGALLPRVALTSTTVAAPVIAPANALTVFNTATAGDVTPGYYYWKEDLVIPANSKWVRLVDSAIEPWNKMLTATKATENIDNIYQKGNVAVGTQNGIGTFHIDAAKNNPATGTPTSTNVLDDIIATPGGRIGFGYNPSDVVISGRQFDDKVTFQANDDLDLNYSLATTNNSQAIVHRNIISSGAIGSRAVRPNGTSIAAFEGHTTTSDNNFALGSLSTQQRAGMVLRTGKYNNFGGEIWFGVSGASAGDGGKTLVNTAGVNYRAVMDQKGNWAFGSDPNFDPFWRAPSERLDIILGGMRIGALGYGTLASWRTVEAAERANYISTDVNDKIVVADANGVLKVKDASAIAPNITTNNGITKNATTSEIELGGTLNRATTITTDATTTLAIAGLQTGSATDKIVVADASGILKTIAAVSPQFFYAPSMVMPTANVDLPSYVTYSGGTFTVDMYAFYSYQFSMTGETAPTKSAIKSAGAGTLNVIPATGLGYFVTYFDNTVYDPASVSLSTDGKLSYRILAGAVISPKTYMNVVFKQL